MGLVESQEMMQVAGHRAGPVEERLARETAQSSSFALSAAAFTAFTLFIRPSPAAFTAS